MWDARHIADVYIVMLFPKDLSFFRHVHRI